MAIQFIIKPTNQSTELHFGLGKKTQGKLSGTSVSTLASLQADRQFGENTFHSVYNARLLELWRLSTYNNATYSKHLPKILDAIGNWEVSDWQFSFPYPAIPATEKGKERQAGFAIASAKLFKFVSFHDVETETEETETDETEEQTELEKLTIKIAEIENIQSAISFCVAEGVTFPMERMPEFFTADCDTLELQKILLSLIVAKLQKSSGVKEKEGSIYCFLFHGGLSVWFSGEKNLQTPIEIWGEFADSYTIIRPDGLQISCNGRKISLPETPKEEAPKEEAPKEEAPKEEAPNIVGLESKPETKPAQRKRQTAK